MSNSRVRRISRDHLRDTATYSQAARIWLVTEVHHTNHAYYLHVRRETHEVGAVSFSMFQDTRSARIENAPRFSAKRLAEIVPPADLLKKFHDELRAEDARQLAAETAVTP